ncbi:unnamed protein product [Anisakis simplex]|uniref:Uncharacterized protein n=1 Tax=Anisakis simplex TaxID=6269 RepID=A0A0M3KFL3_ANISI|nr:unnamed protein product [Anisakis simplex]
MTFASCMPEFSFERHHPTPVYIRNRTNDPDPPLATAALFVSRVASPESCVDEIILGQDSSDNVNNDSNATGNSTDSFPRNADMQYSPLTAGVAECDPQTSSSLPCRKSALITEALSRTSGGVQDTGCRTGTSRVDATARGTVVRSAESIECGAQRDPTLHDFTIDLPADPFLNTIRLPTASTNGEF